MYSTRIMLKINAFTCASFGATFMVFPLEVSTLLGQVPMSIITLLGVALIVNAGHLVFVSFKKTIHKLEVYYFSTSDQIWFLASLALLMMTDWVSTPIGVWVTVVVAIMVSVIGLAQLWTYSEATKSGVPNSKGCSTTADRHLMPENLSRLKSIGLSWLGIKTWIKVWLIILNAVFLTAFLFLPSKLSQVILVAYAASLPLMLSFIIVQRGLTRLLGLGHLVPWTPLLAYTFLRLFTNNAGSQISAQENLELFLFSAALLVFVMVCLAFDIYGLVRWGQGQHGRLGSPSER